MDVAILENQARTHKQYGAKYGFARPADVPAYFAMRAYRGFLDGKAPKRRRDVGACFAWQLAGWVLGAGEIWLALRFLGHQRSALDAVVIEALIQAVSSAAFIVPGALGVQEAAFVVIGTTLGIGMLRGKMHRYRDIPVVCTYHPSALLREEPATVLRKACWEDLQMLLREMGRPVPGKSGG